MSQMTIFDAIEKRESAEPVRNTGLKHRWLIVKHYDSLVALVGTAIPGKETVYILPTKHNDIGVQLDAATRNKIIKQGKTELTYPDYQKWMKKHGFGEASPNMERSEGHESDTEPDSR